MKSIRLFGFLIAMMFCCMASAQQITMYKTFGGVRFERDTLNLTVKQVSQILSVDSESVAEFKKARTNSTVATILGFAGGVLLGIPVGTAIAGGDPEWGMAAGGAALIGVSIPFSLAFKKRAQSAIDQYNSRHSGSRIIPKFYFTGTGGKLVIRF